MYQCFMHVSQWAKVFGPCWRVDHAATVKHCLSSVRYDTPERGWTTHGGISCYVISCHVPLSIARNHPVGLPVTNACSKFGMDQHT